MSYSSSYFTNINTTTNNNNKNNSNINNTSLNESNINENNKRLLSSKDINESKAHENTIQLDSCNNSINNRNNLCYEEDINDNIKTKTRCEFENDNFFIERNNDIKQNNNNEKQQLQLKENIIININPEHNLSNTSNQINNNNIITSPYNENINILDDNNNNTSISNTKTKTKTNSTREIETLTDICSSENLAEVDVISLLDEKIPQYKLRADTIFSHSNYDWIRAPLYIDEQEINALTNEQIRFTLDYFILSGHRVSQMTKTYYDIEAVTKLLDEKERDLELAATIGKQLLEKDQQLEVKIEILELELEKTSEMVNQLRYEITLKDNLLKSFIESENEADFSFEESSKYKTGKLYDVNNHTLDDYRKKITFLEDENEMLRSKADFFEKETAELESKENELMRNCFKELENSQSMLYQTQDELKSKTTECLNQQEEIIGLFSQIYELQSKVKTLTKDNNDLKSLNETSTSETLAQLNDLKEKYNDCISQLSKTQEEINELRFKSQKKKSTLSKSTSVSSNLASSASNGNINNNNSDLSVLNTDDDCAYDVTIRNNSNLGMRTSSSSLYSPWMPTNSLAAEVFNCIAKDYRAKNSINLTQQASQSSDFIKKVKQKLTKQLPGSTIDSCLQSDTEIETMLNNINNNNNPNLFPNQRFAKLTNCPTPDSIFSTGSASIYTNVLGRSSSFLLPEKLQIVKPLEGSQTLQHWQQLATPNLGCLFETRSGISIKVNNFNESLSVKQSSSGLAEKKESDGNCFYLDDEDDDGVNMDMYEDEDLNENEYYFKNINEQRKNEINYDYENKTNKRILSPSKFELLSKLLENEEKEKCFRRDEKIDADHALNGSDDNNNFLFGLFKNISSKYFRANSDSNHFLELDESVNVTNNSQIRAKKKREDYDDPDTPPSSPINLPNSNSSLLYDVFETAKHKLSNYFLNKPVLTNQSQEKDAPTPPGTPTVELADENDQYIINKETHGSNSSKMQNFFDQIVNKLSLFSFKTVTQTQSHTDSNNNNQQIPNFVYKPSPIYVISKNKQKVNSYSSDSFEADLNKETKSMNKSKTEFFSLKEDEDKELADIEKNANESAKSKLCSTPPPSPSKFSPPLSHQLDAMNEEEMKTSAFVKVASLNPHINKSIDLASLLGSLSSLKRNQRLCKY